MLIYTWKGGVSLSIIILTFVITAIIRLSTNIYRLFATKYYYYLLKNSSKKLNECAIPVGVLFEKADTQHIVLCTEKRMSIKQMYHNVISNCLTDPSSYGKLCEVFENTIGVYKYRIRQNFYPMFWITLPITALNSINIHPNKIISFFISILFWLISFFVGYFLERFLNSHLPVELFSMLDMMLK